MDFEQIKELIKIVNDSDLKSFSLNIDGANISMSKNDGMFNENMPVIENKTLSVSEAVKLIGGLNQIRNRDRPGGHIPEVNLSHQHKLTSIQNTEP